VTGIAFLGGRKKPPVAFFGDVDKSHGESLATPLVIRARHPHSEHSTPGSTVSRRVWKLTLASTSGASSGIVAPHVGQWIANTGGRRLRSSSRCAIPAYSKPTHVGVCSWHGGVAARELAARVSTAGADPFAISRFYACAMQ
jgi:hypothetical protein